MPRVSDDKKELNPGQADFDRLINGSANPNSLSRQEYRAAQGTNDGSLSNRERRRGIPDTNWAYTPKHRAGKKKNILRRLTRNRKFLVGGGITGIAIIIPLLILTLLPLKMEMMIKNATQIASSIPAYATEQRFEYLLTRALAARMLGMANNMSEADSKLVFCKTGAVGCSLFATFSNDYFEKKLGITLDVSENGRVHLGGRASNWDVTTVERGTDGNEIGRITKNIQSNAEMKALIKQEVHGKTKGYQVITRYLSRKLLMKKYGVTNWRGPAKVEQATNRLAEARSNLKAGIIKNTVAKISPRTALYLTCLQGSTTTCQKLKDGIDATKTSAPTADTSDIDQAKQPDESLKDSNPDEYARQQGAYERGQLAQTGSQQISDGVASQGSEIVDDAAKNGVSKAITRKVLAIAGAGVGVASILDIVFGAIGSIDDGALDEVSYDVTAQAYTGFSSYIKTTNDAMKAGADSFDSDTMSAAMELFDGVEDSPLYQAESGLPVDVSTASILGSLGSDTASAASGVSAMCDNGSGEKVATRLDPGELVCNDQKLVRGYTKDLQSDASWNGIAAVSAGWNATAGVAFDLAGDVVNGMLQFVPGFQQLMSLVGDAAAPALEWIVGLAFPVPNLGYEATGPENYVAVSGGIRETQNALMKYGQDEDGSAMGGGGRLLTSEEVSAITKEQRQATQEDYDNQPMIAKLFDVNLAGSFMNRLLARMPTSVYSVAKLPFASFTSFLTGTYASAADTSEALANPFNIPLYGYSSDELDADPSEFTETKCKALAKAREESFTTKPDTSVSSVNVYTKSDLCALEKMVVGAALYDAGDYDDAYSFKRVNNVD